ncbi:MAG TPA: porin [Vicinamibacterales bacterium]
MKRLVVVSILCAFAAVRAIAQDKRGFVWNDRPSIVFGDDINVDLKGRALVEWRWFDPDIGEDTFHLRTARVGLKGELTKHFEWEIEREVTESEVGKVEFGEWKDVYVRWKTFDAFSVTGGRFKVPFGLEQTTGISDLDFAYRALGSTAIAPGRDTGVMASGALGRLGYEVGVFDDDGDIAESNEPQFVAEGEDLEGVGPSFAVRVTGDLLRLLPVGRLRNANLGVAYTTSDVPEGLNSLRGESVWGSDFFERVYVKGRRQRLGAQFDWTPGPTGLKAEWLQSREERREQSNRNEDLSDLVGSAWYVAGTWFITGEDKDNNINPRRPLLEGGPGAIEVAVRYEELGYESDNKSGPAFTNPRADNQVPNRDKVWTFGVNWITSKWTRVVVNAIHESFEDANRAPLSGTADYWSSVVRLNIVF